MKPTAESKIREVQFDRIARETVDAGKLWCDGVDDWLDLERAIRCEIREQVAAIEAADEPLRLTAAERN